MVFLNNDNNYLINKICTFETLFDFDLTKNKNIISTCFFRMSTHYKNLSTYINGLSRIIKLIDNQNQYTLRIFIDENIKNNNEIFNLLKSSNKVEIVVFKCSNYMKEGYHFDLFGTLVRYFPFFDFPNNDANNVIVIDIDLHIDDTRRLEALIKYKTTEKEIITMGTTELLLLNKKKPHIYSGIIGYFNLKFNHNIIVDFIKNAEYIKDLGQYGKRLTPFGYGVDELFLSKYLFYKDNSKYIKDIRIGLIFEYTFNWFLYHYKNILMQANKTELYNNLKFILGKYYRSSYKLNDLFNVIDKFMYNQDNINKYLDEKEYLSSKFYQLYHKYKIQHKYLFGDKQIMNLLTYFNNIIYSVSVVYFNPMSEPVDIISIKHLWKNMIKQSRTIKKSKLTKKTKKTKKH